MNKLVKKRLILIGFISFFYQCNVITNIEDAQQKKNTVTKLNLSHQHLTEIPKVVFEMKQLKTLILHDNKITEIPSEIGQANKINELPPTIGNLKKLELFRIGFNNLEFLPDEFCNLESLTHLYLSYNKLIALPDSIHKIPLQELYINWNQLKTVPNNFYDIGSLITVNFAYAGPLFILKEDICKMRRLETLFIDRPTLNFQPRCLEIRSRSNPRFSVILE